MMILGSWINVYDDSDAFEREQESFYSAGRQWWLGTLRRSSCRPLRVQENRRWSIVTDDARRFTWNCKQVRDSRAVCADPSATFTLGNQLHLLNPIRHAP